MSTSNTDSGTMGKASKGALGNNQTLQNSANNNLAFQTQQRNAQFGPQGSMTGMMNPSSLNVTNPQGAYATQYSNEANQVNQGTAQSLASTNRQMANQGGGMQPSGYGAAQTLSANQAGANAKANLFSQNAMASQNQNLQNFWNANNAYGQQGQAAGGQALTGLGTANSTDDSLYGNASQQKQSALGAGLGFLASGAGAASGLGWKPLGK
jgi:hypothetical protein